MFNANLIGMEDMLGDLKTGSLSGNIETIVEDRIFINKKGQRSVAEDERRDVMANALLNQLDALLYVIVDSQAYLNENDKSNFNESIKELVEENRAVKADSLEELLEKKLLIVNDLKIKKIRVIFYIFRDDFLIVPFLILIFVE